MEAIAYGPNEGCVLIGLPAQYTRTGNFADPTALRILVSEQRRDDFNQQVRALDRQKTRKQSSTINWRNGKQYTEDSTWVKVDLRSGAKKAAPFEKM